MPAIRVVDEPEATGDLKAIYERVRAKRGALAEVHKVHSILPHTLEPHIDFYVAVQFGRNPPGGLGRAEREMLAVVVSAANGCAYCVAHHSDALRRYWKEGARVEALARDPTAAGLSPAEAALCAFARKLTLAPRDVGAGDVDALRPHGFGDEAILQTILTVAYFNFVNRLATATGIDPAADVARTYAY